jgi:hypothetical protein
VGRNPVEIGCGKFRQEASSHTRRLRGKSLGIGLGLGEPTDFWHSVRNFDFFGGIVQGFAKHFSFLSIEHEIETINCQHYL